MMVENYHPARRSDNGRDEAEVSRHGESREHVYACAPATAKNRLTDIPNEGRRSNPSPPPIDPAFAGGG
jgi:hypothetical protein